MLELMGFEQLRDFVWTDHQGFYLQFNQTKAGTGAYERYGAGMNHVGFCAPTPEFVTEVQSEMRAAGFEVPEFQIFDAVKALFMKDVEGMRFKITYYRPGVQAVD